MAATAPTISRPRATSPGTPSHGMHLLSAWRRSLPSMLSVSEDGTTGSGRHLLGPHVVGQRVVIRRVLRGETGPSGGPAMTDVLGVCTAWGDGRAVVRTEAGEIVEIATADIVSASRCRRGHRSATACRPRRRRCGPSRCGPISSPSRSARGCSGRRRPAGRRRANSVLAMTRAGVPGADDAVVAHYRSIGQRPIAAVLPGSEEEALFLGRGWGPESNDGNTIFQVASVAHTRRGPAWPAPRRRAARRGRRPGHRHRRRPGRADRLRRRGVRRRLGRHPHDRDRSRPTGGRDSASR